jgi:hypothetical protein
MAINDFKTFAGDPAANVMTQAAYTDVGFTARLLGFSTGTALSIQLNKVWRQSSVMTSMLGQFVVDQTTQDALDDGSPSGMTTLQSRFTTAVRNVALGAIGVGYLPLTGGTLTGNLGVNPTTGAAYLGIVAPTSQDVSIALTRNAGRTAQIYSTSTAAPNPLIRWSITLASNEAETGGNAGSNFFISRWGDGSTNPYIDAPLTISRATGVVNFARSPTVAGGLMPYLPLTGGTVQGNVTINGALATGLNPGIGINFLWPYPGHSIAFGWDGAGLGMWVDAQYQGHIASQDYVWAAAGNYVLKSGDTVTGQFYVNGQAGFRSNVWFGNASDFSHFNDGRYRFRQWASNWFDAWDAQTGIRIWSNVNSWIMTLGYSGELMTTGRYTCNGGRIVSYGNGPSVCVYHSAGVAKGMWCDGNGLWLGQMDGAGNPTRTDMQLDNGGYITISGSGQSNNNWWVGNYMACGGDSRTYGTAYIHNNIVGYTGCIISGSIVAGNAIFGTNGLFAGGNGDTSQGMYRGGSGRVLQMASNWYFDWNAGDGTMAWVRNGGAQWIMHAPSGHCWNAAGQIGGTNFFQTSDERLKRDIVPATEGLSEIMQLEPVRFRRLSSDNTEIGLIAQAVAKILPEALVEYGDDNTQALTYSAITATLVNAVKELGSRVIDLEAYIGKLEARHA